MAVGDVSFVSFSPDRFLNCVNGDGERGLAAAEDVYDRFVATNFEAYIKTMSAIPAYAGIADAFRNPDNGDIEVPAGFDDFLLTVEEFLADRRGGLNTAPFRRFGAAGDYLEKDSHPLVPSPAPTESEGPKTREEAMIERGDRPDGKPLYVRRNLELRSDEPVLWIGNSACQITWHDAFGKPFEPLRAYKELPDDAFLWRVTHTLVTREAYDIFESAYLAENHPEDVTPAFPDHVVMAIRAHGRALHGVDDVEARIEKAYAHLGITIETEDPSIGDDTDSYVYDRIPVSKLVPLLDALEGSLARYPETYLRSSGLKLVRLFDHIRDKERNETWAGFASEDRFTYDGDKVFDHELFHIADNAETTETDDAVWGLEAFGPDYELAFVSRDGKKPAGFISDYAFSGNMDSELEKKRRVKGFGEAQAETANFMLNAPVRVSREALSVEAIARGRNLTKAHYYARSEGLMDERLWRDAANGEEIDRRYWALRLAREEPKLAWFGVEEFEAGATLHRSLETYHLEMQARQDFPGLHPYRARNTYRRLSLENPRNPVYPKLWGDMEWALFWRFDAAASAYAEAVRRGGRDMELFARLTQAWSLGIGPAGAIAGYEALVTEGVRNPELYHELARLYVNAGRAPEALALYESQIASPGGVAYIYHEAVFLAEFGQRLGEEEKKRGWEFVLTWVGLRGIPPEVFHGVVDRLLAAGLKDEAIAMLENELLADPKNEYVKKRLETVRK